MSELTHKPAKKDRSQHDEFLGKQRRNILLPCALSFTLQCTCNILNQCLLCEFKCEHNVITERVQCDGAAVPRGAPPGGSDEARRTHPHHERTDVTAHHSRSTHRERTVKGGSRTNYQVRDTVVLNNT